MRVRRTGTSITALFGLLIMMSGCPQDDLVASDDMAADADMTSRADMSSDSGDSGGDEDQSQDAAFLIDEVNPAQGHTAGGTMVLIKGKGFAPGATVRFGGVNATSVEVKSPTQLSALTPAYDTASAVDVEVINPDGKTAIKRGAFTYQLGGIVETPLYCTLQAQSPLTVLVGDVDAAALYTVIFADGITPGAGQGAGLTAELGIGKGVEHEDFLFQPMTYNVDKDGLTPGDLSNDEYVASPPVTAPGTYRYVARVKTDGDWLYCDLDGSDNGVDVSTLGVLDVLEPAPMVGISYCQIVTPTDPVDAFSGQQTPTLRARVFSGGLTQGAGQGALIEGQVGFGADLAALDTWTYTPLAYQGDADGLAAGDLANDDYGASLIIPTGGTYRYVARFREMGDTQWFYCDRDGHDATDPFEPEQAGTLEVSTPTKPSIGFCQTETPTATTRPNAPTRQLRGAVYVQGLTEGAGAGPGLSAELTWGPAGSAPSSWTDTLSVPYLEDADGLVPGDLANDRYATTLTPSMEGDFDYAYRFSMDGGANWTWCDTDGSSTDPTTFDVTKLGRLEVASINLPDQCRIQFPTIRQGVVVGDDVIVYGRVTEQGITDVSDDAAEIDAEFWVGPIDADPLTEAARFEVVAMSYSAAMPASLTEDEYAGIWSATAPGPYKFVVRMSVDSGAHHAWCDFDGGSYDALKVGVIVVHAAQPDLVDYCHVFQGQVTHSLADPNFPIFTTEVYESGITDNNGGANSALLEAEVGYGAVSTNPALPGAYSWQPSPFTQVNPGNPNNYEYQGSPYDAASAPGAGSTYDVVMRVRETGQSDEDWVYCDNLSSSADFLSTHVSKLIVIP